MLNDKLEKLREDLIAKRNITIALSGGVDSVFLVCFAKEVLGDKVTAVTGTAANFAPDETEYAREICGKLGVKHKVIEISVMDVLRNNPKDRCYHCKKKIFSELIKTGTNLADGTNLDDMSDYRPGLKALEELGIWSPLRDAGLTKAEIRQALKERNISIWDKPAFACLASRIPYGQEITEAKLEAVYKVECALKQMGFTQVRARHHGEVVRIELLPLEWDIAKFKEIDEEGKAAGFKFTALDLEGYKMGRMNG